MSMARALAESGNRASQQSCPTPPPERLFQSPSLLCPHPQLSPRHRLPPQAPLWTPPLSRRTRCSGSCQQRGHPPSSEAPPRPNSEANRDSSRQPPRARTQRETMTRGRRAKPSPHLLSGLGGSRPCRPSRFSTCQSIHRVTSPPTPLHQHSPSSHSRKLRVKNQASGVIWTRQWRRRGREAPACQRGAPRGI